MFDPMLCVGPVVGYLCRSLKAPCGRSPTTGVVRYIWDAQAFLIAIPGLSAVSDLIWVQELVIINTCQRTCTQAKLVRGLDPHGSNALPPKDLILLMSSNGYPTF